MENSNEKGFVGDSLAKSPDLNKKRILAERLFVTFKTSYVLA